MQLVLPKRCHSRIIQLTNPHEYWVYWLPFLIPTRQVHMNTKHIRLVFSVFFIRFLFLSHYYLDRDDFLVSK